MKAEFQALIRLATLAPSGHNTQPWKFATDGDAIEILADFERRLPVVDPDDHALYISLGCALENLVIAAGARGLAAEVEYLPDRLRVVLQPGGAGEGTEPLLQAMSLRQSNRRDYDDRFIPEDEFAELVAANSYATVETRALRRGDPALEPIIELVKQGNRTQFNDRDFVDELVSWIRFSRREAEVRKDGLTAQALGFPPIPRWLGRLIMTRLVRPEGEAAKQEKALRSSALVMIFVARENDRRHWIDVGRSFEHTALIATSLGIAHAHVNMACEVEPLRARLAAHLGYERGEQPLLLIRFGYAKTLPHTPRRPLEQVVVAA
ncbi:MAG: hypothetical protein JJU27_17515 [Gammaproteobacteria bacterium]|nr:hypothetical protein [Gammaproteobacteria bacterium]